MNIFRAQVHCSRCFLFFTVTYLFLFWTKLGYLKVIASKILSQWKYIAWIILQHEHFAIGLLKLYPVLWALLLVECHLTLFLVISRIRFDLILHCNIVLLLVHWVLKNDFLDINVTVLRRMVVLNDLNNIIKTLDSNSEIH